MRISDWSSDVCSSDLSGCACERAAQMGSGACRRAGPCLSRSRTDEAGADGDRSPAARAGQAEDGARLPKKGRRLLREGIDIRFQFIAKHRWIWPVAWIGGARGVARREIGSE